MSYLLEKAGYAVISADDGRRGIQTAQEQNPDAILLDIQLPVMDGYEVAKALRKIPDLMAIPIIAVTSYAMPGDREKCIAAGASDYIEKPINPDIFVEQISKHVLPQFPDSQV